MKILKVMSRCLFRKGQNRFLLIRRGLDFHWGQFSTKSNKDEDKTNLNSDWENRIY